MEHLIWYNGFENMNQIILGTTKHSDLLYQIHIDSNSFFRCKKIIQAMLLSQHQVSSVPFVGPIPSTGAATIAAKGGGMQYHQSCKQPYQQQQTPTAKSCARSCAVTVTRTTQTPTMHSSKQGVPFLDRQRTSFSLPNLPPRYTPRYRLIHAPVISMLAVA